MLIKAYGEFWNPNLVDWGKVGAGNKGKLIGKGKVSKQKGAQALNIDFWEARGIYVLYDRFRVIYVGKVVDQDMGKRLRDHLTAGLLGDGICFHGIQHRSRTRLTKTFRHLIHVKSLRKT